MIELEYEMTYAETIAGPLPPTSGSPTGATAAAVCRSSDVSGLALLIALAAFWNWDWFIPIVQSRASAAIGRPVTVSHLHLHLGRVVTVIVDGVVVANPPDWPNGDPPFVSIKSLTIQPDAWVI